MNQFTYGCILAAGMMLTAPAAIFAETVDIGYYTYTLNADRTQATLTRVAQELAPQNEAVIPASISVDGAEVPVTGLAIAAFSNLPQLDRLTIEDSEMPLEIGRYGLDDVAYHYYIGRNLNETPDYPSFFRGSAVSIVLGDLVTDMNSLGAPSYCYGSENLKSVTIGSGVKAIPAECFRACPNLASLTLSEGVEKIETAFIEGTAITELTLPATVRSMATGALRGSSVTTIWCLGQIPPEQIPSAPVTWIVPVEALDAYRQAPFPAGTTIYGYDADRNIVASAISVSEFPSPFMYPGETVTLTASVTPEIASDKSVVWESSDPSVAVVDADGDVTAVAPGYFKVTATAASGISATTGEVEVLPPGTPALPKIDTFTLHSGRIVTAWDEVTVKCRQIGEGIYRDRFEWTSSDESILKVISSDGGTAVLRPVGPGSAVLTVRSVDQPEKSSSAEWAVILPELSIIEDSAQSDIMVDETVFLTVLSNFGSPDGNFGIETTADFWEMMRKYKYTVEISDPSILERIEYSEESNYVYSHNQFYFRALAPGTATITLRIPGLDLKVEKTVTVLPLVLQQLGIYSSTHSPIAGFEYTATARTTPSGVADSFRWSTPDPDIVSLIGTQGTDIRFKALKAGDFTIHVESVENPDIYCDSHYTSEEPRLTLPEKLEIENDGAKNIVEVQTNMNELLGLFYDETDLPDNPPITLENSNPGVIRLEEFPYELNRLFCIYPLRPGRATVKATLRGTDISATMEVIVQGSEVYRMDVAVKLTPGSTLMLDARCLPDDAYDRSVVWESSDSNVATVKDGLVTGVCTGRAMIFATSNDNPLVADTINVRVMPLELTAFELQPDFINASPGDVVTLTPLFTPTGGWQPAEWQSSDPEVATCFEGVVTIHKEGECVITAVPVYDRRFSARCVINASASLESYFASDDARADIYNLAGHTVLYDAPKEYALRLPPGIYIINGKTYYKH